MVKAYQQQKQQQGQRQKLNVALQREQAFSVMLNIVEFGIAGICHKRGIFPEHFFRHNNIRPKGKNVVTTFDIDSLNQLETLSSSQDELYDASYQSNTNETVTQQQQQLEFMSPITSSFVEPDFTPKTRMQQSIDRLKAEALLLRRWILDGVGMSMKKGMLSRVTFSVYSTRNQVTSKNDQKSSMDDKLLESYAFHFSLNERTGKQLQHNDLIHATETLFQNLDGFSSTLSPLFSIPETNKVTSNNNNDGYQSSSQLSMTMSTDKESDAETIFPSSRYLSLRFHFSKEISADLFSGNRSLVNPFLSKNSELSSEVIQKQSTSLKSMPLGGVNETNISGLRLQMTASYRDDEAETLISDGNDESMIEKLDTQTSTGYYARRNEISKHTKEDKPKVTMTKKSQIVCPQQRRTQTMAIPFGITSPTEYLPCTVIDRRLHESKGVQYKVMFSDERLIKMRMKKQWISADKVIWDDLGRHKEERRKGATNNMETNEISVRNLKANETRLHDKRIRQYDPQEPNCTKLRRFSYIIDPITVKSRIIL